MTYEHALQLFRRGHLRDFVDAGKANRWREFDSDARILSIYAVALAAETTLAASMLRIEAPQQKSARARFQIAAALGLISWRSGNLDDASKHLSLAVNAALESKDPEWAAWAYLHLLRFTVDAKPLDALTTILRPARAAVIRAGTPPLAAYLHISVAAMEAGRGHFDEAWRHCDVAESLLDIESNAWVLGMCRNMRGGIASFRCEFEKAAEYFRSTSELADANGSRRLRMGAELNRGFLELVTGQYGKAEGTLKEVLLNVSGKERLIEASDFLARVYLAVAKLDQCQQVLDGLNLYGDSFQYAEYAKRWTAFTRAKLLLKRRQHEEALKWLELVRYRSLEQGDRAFDAALDLLTAQGLHRIGRQRDCAQYLLRSDLNGIRQITDLQGQYQYTLATIVANEATRLAMRLEHRATRIWLHQGMVSVRSEIDDGFVRPTPTDVSETQRTGDFEDVATVVNSIGAAFDVAYSPHLLGTELINVLETAGCFSNVSLRETVDGLHDGLDQSGRRLTLRLGDGVHAGKSVMLSCDVPASPAKALVLADIFRVGRAALALEKARREERSRAALWPSEPLEEQGDAIFIAEESQVVVDTARRIAATNIPVLITGETGTGKEVLARLIHSYSPRASKTFLPFNCTAIPRDTLDSQLFGHRRGAFTGASENFVGVIRAAAGGTLFLDEIGESTLEIQPKLLRFLESGEVHPLGDTYPQRVDVRVIAATNADVDALVSQGRFREDLFYRLNIVRLHIPPLRERRVEIPAFANHYLQKYAKEMAKGELCLSEETMEYLVLYRWPGNVRQLANEMRRLAALAEPNAVLMPEHLCGDIAASRRTMPASDRMLDASEIVVRTDQPFGAAIQHLERAMVQAALQKASSVDEAAKLLGVSRKGLYLKRLRYGMEIDRPKSGTT